ncbi:aldehyde dehydrogenase family protein [Paracoccus limosus]|uniref:Aldehyde dehydrogenase family protein n=1 Tax=Paracoccus limosus TaxID=913252 RepID=A0A844H3W4_9RHOB|nr:aldehyde dehydrogenase family protein [Paracoccus limosus]
MQHPDDGLCPPAGRTGSPDGESGYYTRLNPADGTVASRVPAHGVKAAVAAVNAAARAFPGWSGQPAAARRAVLDRAAGLIDGYAPEIARLMRAEIGATDDWVRFNLDIARRHLETAADLTEHIGGGVRRDAEGLQMCFRDPVGVCLAIAPWNAPFVLGMRAVATALACGNTVVLKASENCPAMHMLIGRVLAEAGFLPEGALGIVTHAPDLSEEIVTALIAHDAVRRVNFTGSTRVGRIVAELAGRHLKRCLLELGGKAPFIVLEDADLDAAADAAAFGSFFNQGQICMATDRIIVMEQVADAFAQRLAALARNLRAGDPMLGGYALGPMVSEGVAQRIEDMVADAVAKGAMVLAGGARRGPYVDAVVLDRVEPGMMIYAEECFGPVAAICRVQSEAEAIGIANDTRYGLSGAVFGRDIAHALGVARRIDSGMCHVNAPTLNDRPDMPVGGVKDSGFGRFGGVQMLDEFTETRWIDIARAPRRTGFGRPDSGAGI